MLKTNVKIWAIVVALCVVLQFCIVTIPKIIKDQEVIDKQAQEYVESLEHD